MKLAFNYLFSLKWRLGLAMLSPVFGLLFLCLLALVEKAT